VCVFVVMWVCVCVLVRVWMYACVVCEWCNWMRGVYVGMGVREFGCVCWLGICVRACG